MMEIRPHLTEASAAVQASRLLRNDNIVNRIAEVRKEQRAILESKVLGQHDQILEYDPLDFFDVNETLNTVELKPIHKLPEWLRKLCTLDTKIVDKELKTVVVAPDKDKSRFELAKILGMITSKGEIEHKGDAVTALLAALDGGSKQIVATGATDATAE
jgi:phage terminase small subunit